MDFKTPAPEESQAVLSLASAATKICGGLAADAGIVPAESPVPGAVATFTNG